MTAGLRSRAQRAGLVLLAIVVWLAATSWLRPLAVPDEGRYVGVAWEMLRSGDWLTPTLDGLPFFHKPPLFYWITGASLATFGMNEWAARVAPLLGATAGALALFSFARRWAGPDSARLSAVVLVTQPLFFIGAQFANLDMLVAGCISVTVLALAHAVLAAQQGAPHRGALALAYLFAALGVLAKGLIGAVLPALVIGAWLLVLRRYRALIGLVWLPGIALFVLVAAPWFAAMQQQFPEFGHYFFVVQHFQRFAQGGFNNAQPAWFYLVVLALLTLPWFAWLAPATRRAYWSDPQQGPVRKLMWVWVAVVAGFFSLPQSKIVGYILPATVPLAFLIGDSVAARLGSAPAILRWWKLSAAIAAVACVAAAGYAAVYPQKSLRSLARVLAAQAAPGEPVVFLRDYYFDVAFHAGLRAPVLVVEDWGSPTLARKDNWHNELLHARQFAPPSTPPVLLSPADLSRLHCSADTRWVIGSYKLAGTVQALGRVTEAARSGETVLWRVAGAPDAALSAPGCPGKPSAN